ncbi:hypothetical protein OSTOST_02694 [Ostertagia ostertagi]
MYKKRITSAKLVAEIPTKEVDEDTDQSLWEPNPENPHNRDHANKWWYQPYSVTTDWLNGQVAFGGHWAVPAVSVGGSNLYEGLFFPSVGTFLGIEDDYDYE